MRIATVALAGVLMAASAMRLDPERIAARLRIDGELTRAGRGRRQLATPKEISIQVTAPLFSSRLFEYGKEAGDSEVPAALDVAKKLVLKNPINFLGEEITEVFILSNGGIGFESSSKTYKANLLPNGSKMIAPFWNRNDPRNGGHIWYREVTGGRVLERGQSEIRYQYDKMVKVRSAIVATWENMQPLGAAPLPVDNTNTFQAAIFITDNGCFANFIYSNIGWTQGAEAGFNKGDGKVHYALPTSGTGNIMYLEEYGNTGIPGEWMFEVTSNIIRCKAGIKGDTCDQECQTGEFGPDCSRCCHCNDGKCHAVTGECTGECAVCYSGKNCQTKSSTCPATNTHKCAVNAISFTDTDRCGEAIQRCQCLEGYKGDGYIQCEDVNECANRETCHSNAICTNTPGHFFCQCNEGFSGDGVHECISSFLFPSKGHQPLPKSKSAKITWQLKSPMNIFGSERNHLTITTSGLISPNDVPEAVSAMTLEQGRIQGIAPLHAQTDTSMGGEVTVQETTESDVLTRVTRTIRDHTNDASFIATSALIVTAKNVSTGAAKNGNTYQAVLASGTNSGKEKVTYAQLLYKDLPLGDGAEAGIMSPDAANSVLLPGSGTNGVEQLTQLSNIQQPGIWLYRIDTPRVPGCPRPHLVQPYCDPRTSPATSLRTKPIPHEESQQIEFKPMIIHPTIVNGRPPSLATTVTTQKPRIITTRASTTTTSIATTTTRPTHRVPPVFQSTPHKSLVSFSDTDIENIPPDAFEIATFPPFVTVIPQIFTPTTKSQAKQSKMLPEFAPTLIHEDTTEPMMTSTKRWEEPQNIREEQQREPPALPPVLSPILSPAQPDIIQEIGHESEQKQLLTSQSQSNTSQLLLSDDTNQPLFVFTTTSKQTTRAPSKKPKIVTAGTTTNRPANGPFRTWNSEAEQSSASNLAIIIPSVIVAVWLLLLLVIFIVVCCRKRSSRRRLQNSYGPAYNFSSRGGYGLKRGSTHIDPSYEDHLDKAARLSSEMTAYNQTGRVSLYGSYWNLSNPPSSTINANGAGRQAAYQNGAYTNTQRYVYTGRY